MPPPKISQILDLIDDNSVLIPAFQREYVWKRDDAKQLLDSLIKEYPTGTLLIWETTSPPELKGNHIYDARQGAVRILLDGQQRITTLYMLIKGELPPYYRAEEITHDTRGLFVNLETLELEYYSRIRMENDPRWLDITSIFKGDVKPWDQVKKISDLGQELSGAEQDKIHQNFAKIVAIKERYVEVQTIPVHASIRDAIDIFYKVNAGGVALTDAELALAQISGYWPQARERFKDKLEALKKDGFVFKLDFIVYVLLGVLHHGGSEMKKLHSEDNDQSIREAWESLETNVLDYVTNLLRSHAFVDHTDEINSIYALVPIIVHCHRRECKLSHIEVLKVVKWFYYSQMRRRYVSQLPQKLDHDLKIVRDSNAPFDRLLDVIKEERGGSIALQPEEFSGRAWQHPLFAMMRWHLKSRGARCLTTGISIHKPMGERYKLEKDHIFAYSRLKAAGYGAGNRLKYALAQELTNRAILTQAANRMKGAKNASEFLESVELNHPKALELQLIPRDRELWAIDRYEDFLAARRKLLATSINDWLDSIAETESVDEEVSIEDLIVEGENEDLELKETLRWDVREGSVNKDLEAVVLKTIAAFANATGGTLIIGVKDKGDIVGLDNDYKALGGGDKDKFELHVTNLVAHHFGQTFRATKLKVSFPQVQGVEICRVDVAKANQPVFLKLSTKGAPPQEKFLVRSGNSSQDLAGAEAHAYIAERFG